jgi:hypothetical protein
MFKSLCVPWLGENVLCIGNLFFFLFIISSLFLVRYIGDFI